MRPADQAVVLQRAEISAHRLPGDVESDGEGGAIDGARLSCDVDDFASARFRTHSTCTSLFLADCPFRPRVESSTAGGRG
ncbi:hypothetical protein GCM10009612_55930 [Streptomyces beijiangensis]